jgi:hypothetical protein
MANAAVSGRASEYLDAIVIYLALVVLKERQLPASGF